LANPSRKKKKRKKNQIEKRRAKHISKSAHEKWWGACCFWKQNGKKMGTNGFFVVLKKDWEFFSFLSIYSVNRGSTNFTGCVCVCVSGVPQKNLFPSFQNS
jgi:hypothetical protein